ncbi:CRTAC1 family protein [Actinomadura logoneensis]|uniref:CRTAC1 family protein n=2 Tax=Actinomadura logoneensis TaxID=2293572 RepID=A0A372JAZ8_9ACTN|nr:CRTAC1 family protein [Actinomadura logoneensis]
MSFSNARMRGLVPGAVVLAAVLVLYFAARLPTASGAERERIASRYSFAEQPIAMPAGYRPDRTVRDVNPAYRHIRSWISSVGAAVAMTDLWGRGRADALCLVDPRSDQVVVTYAPTAPAADRFAPFTLSGAPLPMDASMAPMGCAPGDFNQDGRTDLMVYYWGRTPILFLAKASATAPGPSAYAPAELVPNQSPDGRYHGPRWNTDAVNVADYDGTGRPHILVSNYFPDSDVLNPHAQNNVTMNSSMSNAKNGGGSHVLRWYGATAGDRPAVQYVEEKGAIPPKAATGWTLAASSADLTGDGRPELYLANDFGKDHLLYNTSTPGRIGFTEAKGKRGPTTPKSFVMGKSSFKGMGVDFGDLDNKGRFDMVVSNITSAWGLEESNFAWINTAKNPADAARRMADGDAPFAQKAEQYGLAWTGWGWDVKTGDFRNDGNLEILQAEGFVKGDISRWPWLQEMAMTNDQVYTNPAMWPHVRPGDDVAGDQPMAFYTRRTAKPSGKFVNVTSQLGLDARIPTRGIAIGDTRGGGTLDFAVARQWGPPAFFVNNSPGRGNYLELNLVRPVAGAKPGRNLTGYGTPAYGAQAEIRTADGRTQVSRLDGGGGHSGKRSLQVHFGLGADSRPVSVRLQWCAGGRMQEQTLTLTPGTHTLSLDRTAEEVATR